MINYFVNRAMNGRYAKFQRRARIIDFHKPRIPSEHCVTPSNRDFVISVRARAVALLTGPTRHTLALRSGYYLQLRYCTKTAAVRAAGHESESFRNIMVYFVLLR